MADSGLAIVLGDWQTLGNEARRVREEVFVIEQGIPRSLEWDVADPQCVHCLATTDGLPPKRAAIATGRLLPDGHIGRMAVLAAHRGRGVGRAVLRALIGAARDRGHTEVILNAQQYVCEFYRREGFVEFGEPFEEAGIAHVSMRLDL